jgi:hypothetical protein
VPLALAILTALTLRAVFRLALRQAEDPALSAWRESVPVLSGDPKRAANLPNGASAACQAVT